MSGVTEEPPKAKLLRRSVEGQPVGALYWVATQSGFECFHKHRTETEAIRCWRSAAFVRDRDQYLRRVGQ